MSGGERGADNIDLTSPINIQNRQPFHHQNPVLVAMEQREAARRKLLS